MSRNPHRKAPTTLARSPGAPAESAPKGCTNFKLRQITRRVSRDYDAAVSASGLKTTQYSLLSHIATLGPISPGELATRMNLDASTLTRNLQPLIARGWAELGPGPDGRTRRVSITEAGRAKRVETQRLWKHAQLALNERLGVERVARLHELIDECLGLLDAAEAEEGDPDEP